MSTVAIKNNFPYIDDSFFIFVIHTYFLRHSDQPFRISARRFFSYYTLLPLQSLSLFSSLSINQMRILIKLIHIFLFLSFTTQNYENGNYNFDPLRFRPDEPDEYRDMMNKELNNGRLAMVAMIGMIVQEYFTGVPATVAFLHWLDSGGILDLITSPFQIIQAILNIPEFITQQLSAKSSAYSSGTTIPNALQ